MHHCIDGLLHIIIISNKIQQQMAMADNYHFLFMTDIMHLTRSSTTTPFSLLHTDWTHKHSTSRQNKDSRKHWRKKLENNWKMMAIWRRKYLEATILCEYLMVYKILPNECWISFLPRSKIFKLSLIKQLILLKLYSLLRLMLLGSILSNCCFADV